MARNVSVTDYLDELDHRGADAVVALRQLILDAIPGIHERINWNAPSFGPLTTTASPCDYSHATASN